MYFALGRTPRNAHPSTPEDEMPFLARSQSPPGPATEGIRPDGADHDDARSLGSLKFVADRGGNTSDVAYQEASGAPVETNSPLGYAVGPATILFLNLTSMIGTASAVLAGTGSVGLSLIIWTFGMLTSLASLSVHLEFAAYFPSRSGNQVVYLEQAYPRPKWFFPTVFAIQSVVFSFGSANAFVMARYLFAIGDYEASSWETKALAIAGFSLVVLVALFSTRISYRISNLIGAIKLLTLVMVSILGLVVLGGNTKVEDPKANFRDSFGGATTVYGVTDAIYKIIFSYAGFENVFNVVNEVQNPVKNIRNYGFSSILIVAMLYILCNIAFFAAIPLDEMIQSKEVAASLLFTQAFGERSAVRGLNFLISLSSFGNLLAMILGQSRLLRECGRQGVLPWPNFWASTKPFGTPVGPYFVQWLTTVIMIIGPPAGDAFNFITDLAIYPGSVFSLCLGIGLFLVRRQRKRLSLPRPSFRTWDAVLLFNILVQIYLLVMPWWPPEGGATGGDVSFWYGTYIVVGMGVLLLCSAFYVVWIVVLPKAMGYRMRQQLLKLDNGALAHALVKVPVDALEQWDRVHDASGYEMVRQGSDEHEMKDMAREVEDSALAHNRGSRLSGS